MMVMRGPEVGLTACSLVSITNPLMMELTAEKGSASARRHVSAYDIWKVSRSGYRTAGGHQVA